MIAALVLAVALTQSDWESKQIGIAPSLARVETVGRRSVTWFEHDADPTWGGRAFRDSFAIASPVTGDRAGAPLLVVLHWRGGGMPGKGVDCQADAVDDKNRVFSAPDDFYVLMLDDIRDYNVLLGRTHDEYWWGATPNYAGPTVADVPRLLACETTCEKRVLDCVEWTIRRFGIERSRVYLCGNSMGGQAAEAIGLSHGEIFAAVNANVPATVWFAAARLGFVGPDGRDREDWSVERFADPPLLVDWSGVDDVWSRDREVVYRNVAKRKWAMIGLWETMDTAATCWTRARGTILSRSSTGLPFARTKRIRRLRMRPATIASLGRSASGSRRARGLADGKAISQTQRCPSQKARGNAGRSMHFSAGETFATTTEDSPWNCASRRPKSWARSIFRRRRKSRRM